MPAKKSVEELLVDTGERDRCARDGFTRGNCALSRCVRSHHLFYAPRAWPRRLKEVLRTKLIECGWRDELKEHCKEVIRSKGKEKITVDELTAEITPHGRGAPAWSPVSLSLIHI